MSHFKLDLPAETAGSLYPGPKHDKLDDRSSQSGSDDGSTYADMPKPDGEHEEGSNKTSLTSQTLNADGTPKRPMNAFMIFARRRRPQVSAENQAMRTGEISKILSKEWTSMPQSDKQFYLDQAKQLKDSFNTKYPDYVYRRRPNNSRRRRPQRPDGSSVRHMDNPLPCDAGDDNAILDPGESSHTDGEDSQLDGTPDYSRPSHDVSQSYGEHSKYGSSQTRTSSYPYPPSEISFRSNAHESRLPYVSPAIDHLSHDASPSISLRTPPFTQQGQNSSQYPYLSAQNHGQNAPMFSDNNGHGGWESRMDHVRASSAWLSTNTDRSLAALSQKPHSYSSSSAAQTTWPNSTSSTPSLSNGSNSSTPFSFPTLSSPFFPNNSQGQGLFSTSASVSQAASPAPYTASSSSHLSSSLGGREYENRRYTTSPAVSSSNPYPSSASRDALMFHQSRSGSAQRGLSSLHSNFSHSQAMQPTAGADPGISQVGYWGAD